MMNLARFDAPFWGLVLVGALFAGAASLLGVAATAQSQSMATLSSL